MSWSGPSFSSAVEIQRRGIGVAGVVEDQHRLAAALFEHRQVSIGLVEDGLRLRVFHHVHVG